MVEIGLFCVRKRS
uniref:Uncharacterized protein n=1 Tax=Rhizophora mucronata TaxID=61149 RepID=A0A2P2J410_RHIMU